MDKNRNNSGSKRNRIENRRTANKSSSYREEYRSRTNGNSTTNSTRSNRSRNYSSSKKKARQQKQMMRYAGLLLVVISVIIASVIVVTRYTPTKDHMELSKYFEHQQENQTSVIYNGQYCRMAAEDNHVKAVTDGQVVYVALDFVKDNIDDGFVYDFTENILRYTTDKDVYSVTLGNTNYSVGKSYEELGHQIVYMDKEYPYIALDYIYLLSDIEYKVYENPSRVVIETAGTSKTVATAKKKTPARRFGGNKSLILEDVVKGEKVSIVENYGKWSLCLTENGVLGCIRNNKLSKQTEEIVESHIAEREYNHISIGEDILVLWHQVSGGDTVADTVKKAEGADVLCPTWYYLKDNQGGIANNGSTSYVNYCHSKGIQVWGLVSNLEDKNVDTTYVLNTTSARDALVNNLIATAITTGLDGINVDIESLSAEAKDGYIEFIKELSLKCEDNNIVLSVDNYVPTPSSMLYNRTVESQYCDYVIVMAYDEHYAGSQEAGSVASYGYVEDGIKNTLEEADAAQVILGIPLYCRVWIQQEDGSLTSNAMGIDAVKNFMKTNGVTPVWLENEKQYYAEFAKGNKQYKVWVEEEESIEEKLKLMQQYKLSGAALWKYGFDTEDLWSILAKYL